MPALFDTIARRWRAPRLRRSRGRRSTFVAPRDRVLARALR
ncbi:MAG: hypothetical protein P0Y48_10595 [Candidatus Microbacterium phytovorans]|uniref:Uncharacterized protein n=1 Tax=Candidatus Microbacterium phytovorans TaxID=3121374 RepID=A0AAJ5VZU2_9MICO|nr:hypothetical protein [Microbacterium sp.]WEK12910.1 MAG: hypothetical protein P0Y48_10595 [Microbacterium sp.]